MRLLFLIGFSFLVSSCGFNKRISKLEAKVVQLNDSIAILKVLNIPGNYDTMKNITFLGIDAGKFNNSSENVFIGNFAGAYSYKTRNSVFVGIHSGVNSNTGYGNVAIGNYSGQNIYGENNTLIGKGAANQPIGSNNVVIGTHAGTKFGDFSDKLIIESSDSKKPLIYGDFKVDSLVINADLSLDGLLRIIPKSTAPKKLKEGTIFYDSTTKKLKIWNGEIWDILN
ncbi:MAG TPA: hypothetical protein DCS17_09425 [Flavobacterium sp.]|nr:hypothetical protein [Flavobacterium sp.]